MVYYQEGPPPTFSQEEWLRDKFLMGLDFPDLPYFIDGEVRITEAVAIQKYIAAKWGPKLLGRTPAERAKVNMVGSIVSDLKGSVTSGCYMDRNRPGLVEKIFDKVPKIVKFLDKKKFLVGDNLCWVDFYFFELLDFM
mmetsp:Transcript_22366/g.34626  ORF Transcript_22366/g.34626 Transcript_22366/m.34626 type:complete len:138 (+) Transcript_22366:228-641(+)|eukprot:CAMPEP_0170503478 /NCGR_PEP_ID=MMETSP0208-20121228/44914_1 /TAXON_ID=197538 /ORGANISM="Strombidium inclinatum, Strain S3" /LENGTH=137 /DNA_ID=CAMNT_0010783165 /DNA_START=201 /DNA_END=614 /DNA_ORIENTATION=-